MYKLISLDLDGTLFNNNRQISQENYNTVNRCIQNGYQVVIATGRPPRFTFDKLPEHLTDGYCMCYNGAQIYHQRNLVFEKCLDKELVKSIIKFVTNEQVAIEVDDVIYANFDVAKYWSLTVYKPLSELKMYSKVCKILIINKDDLAIKLKNSYGNYCQIITTDQDRLIEMMHLHVNKFEGIMWILNKLLINIHEVIAFGDDRNDIELIEAAGLGVAMGNAIESLKRVSKHVTSSNDHNGVAILLESILEGCYE